MKGSSALRERSASYRFATYFRPLGRPASRLTTFEMFHPICEVSAPIAEGFICLLVFGLIGCDLATIRRFRVLGLDL
jgi:hypothetical protein